MRFIGWDKDIAEIYHRCFVSIEPQSHYITRIHNAASPKPTFSNLQKWCKENLTGDIMIPYHASHWFFENEADAMAFKLRWE